MNSPKLPNAAPARALVLGAVALVPVLVQPSRADTWVANGPLNLARYAQTATLLLNGKVLVAGGIPPGGVSATTQTAETYDPATGTWVPTGPMSTPRSSHTATMLSNGMILVAGGLNNLIVPTQVAELYDPAAGSWTNTGFLAVGRKLHTSTLLPNGKVLVTGGATYTNSNYAAVAAAE